MTELKRKCVKFEWTEECQNGFEYLKTCLTEALILKYPDTSKRYVVFTDVSDQAAAAILTQVYTGKDGGTKEMPIAYLSLQFSNTHFNPFTAATITQYTTTSYVPVVCMKHFKWKISHIRVLFTFVEHHFIY